MSTEDWLSKRHFYYPSLIIACGGSVDDFDQILGLRKGSYAKWFDKALTCLRSQMTCPACERAIIANAADCLACRTFVMTRKDVSGHTCDPQEAFT